jgi:Transposase DDE domain group 1
MRQAPRSPLSFKLQRVANVPEHPDQPSATAIMIDATPLPFDLPSVRRKKLTVDFEGGNQSSDAGLLLLRQAERKLGVCGRLAAAMPDRRDASRIRHEMFEMVMARALAIACGHEDAIDLDRLRHDPLMKVAVGRCPVTSAPLASQSTISRLENAPSKTEAARLAAALVDQAGTTVKPGKQAILDIDDTFCAAHGGQQLAFWNAHHDERGFSNAVLCVPATCTALMVGTTCSSPSWRATRARSHVPPPWSVDSFAQHATTMFFPHFVGDACSRQSYELGEWCIWPA